MNIAECLQKMRLQANFNNHVILSIPIPNLKTTTTMPRNHLLTVLILLLLCLPGCSGKPIRHLASDICLVSEGTTRHEVMTYLGMPNDRQMDQANEIWIYYQVNKSLLRKTPFIGNNLGEEDVDVITVRFTGDQVKTCAYRHLTPEEFKNFGMDAQYEPGDK